MPQTVPATALLPLPKPVVPRVPRASHAAPVAAQTRPAADTVATTQAQADLEANRPAPAAPVSPSFTRWAAKEVYCSMNRHHKIWFTAEAAMGITGLGLIIAGYSATGYDYNLEETIRYPLDNEYVPGFVLLSLAAAAMLVTAGAMPWSAPRSSGGHSGSSGYSYNYRAAENALAYNNNMIATNDYNMAQYNQTSSAWASHL